MSWVNEPGGYHLLCNRDEKRTRGIAEPPRRMQRAVSYIAPTDTDGGGTWIAVNEYGLALCLLNGQARAAERSRGLVIPELIWARSIDDCSFLLTQLDLPAFAGFTLLMLEPGSPATVATWDGERAAIDGDARAPLTSSSYAGEAVRHERLQQFALQSPAGPEALLRFHASHAGSSPAHAPCMHREDAETVSFSWVTVTDDEIRFRYLPSAPCTRAA